VSIDRRRFAHHLLAGGAALGGFPLLAGATERAANDSDWRGLDQPPTTTYDTSWTSKLTGKYKAVFDVPDIHEGSGVWRAGLWFNHYTDVLKAPPSELSSVIVIRHAAIPLIMSHEFWETYDMAKEHKTRHPMTGKKSRRNPVLMTESEDAMPATFAKLALQEQIKRGTVVLACGMAFSAMTQAVVKRDKLSQGDAKTKAMSMVVPGVIMQPNGIFGVTLAQHHGCVFVAAS
jgi:hypothetical protein